MMNKLTISKSRIEEIQQHCNAEMPMEAVGLVAGNKDGEVLFVQRLVNDSSELNSFFVNPYSQFKAFKIIKEKRLFPLALYHSHINAPAIPSPTDIHFAKMHNLIQIIISVNTAMPDRLNLKAFLIKDPEKIAEFPVGGWE